MSSESFWDSDEGRDYRRWWREVTTARGVVASRPKSKGARGAVQERELIVAAAEEFQRSYSDGEWPRPKADVALDVWAVTTKDAPQPQNFAKRLLDQLGPVDGKKPIVYHDDRQVTMLYVRVDEIEGADPTIYFDAQRSSVIRSEIRRAPDTSIRERFRARQEELDSKLETARDWIAGWRGGSDLDEKFYAMGVRGERFYLQASALHANDHVARSVVEQYAAVPPRRPEPFLGLVAKQLNLLAAMPYAFDLGTLPMRGGTEACKQSVADRVRFRISKYPWLFPPQIPMGVTAFYVPGPDGKDLDNIFRELVLPVLLQHCRIPRELRHPYGENTEDTDAAAAYVAFIEGVALTGVPRSAGSVVVTLSDGRRHRSWWHVAMGRDEHRSELNYPC